MDAEQLKAQAVWFNRARNTLLLVVVLTLANLVLIALDVNLNFPFSAVVPQVILIWFLDVAFPIAMTAAVISVSVYLLFFFLSKRWRVFILVALIFFAIDTLFLLDLMFTFGFTYFLIDIAFHAWIHFSLIMGTVAWAKLRNVSGDDFRAAVAIADAEANEEELKSALDTVASGDEENSDNKD